MTDFCRDPSAPFDLFCCSGVLTSWVGERRVAGGCNDDNIASDSYSLAPREIGSKEEIIEL